MNGMLTGKLDLISIGRDLLRAWYAILAIGVSAGLWANIWVTASYEPRYKTSTTFAVTDTSSTQTIYQNLSSAKELAGRLVQILEGNELRQRVIGELGLPSFDAEVSVSQVSETNLVVLSVTSDTAPRAYQILNCIMDNYGQVTDYVLGDVLIQVISPARVPTAPSNSLDTRAPMKHAFLAGAVVTAALVAWLSYQRDTVKNESQIAEKIDAKFLGTIGHERKKKRGSGKYSNTQSMLITNPLRSYAFVEANLRVASRARNDLDRHGKKIVLVTSVLGNEGKSTLAANIALAIALEGKNVLLVDFDFRKPSQYKIFQAPKRDRVNLIDAIRQNTPPEELIKRYKTTSLFVLFNDTVPSSIDNLTETGELKRLIDTYREHMDYIIIDTAPIALVADTEELIRLAETSLLVVREDAALAMDINDAIDLLKQDNKKMMGCVFSNASKKPGQTYGNYRYGKFGGYYG